MRKNGRFFVGPPFVYLLGVTGGSYRQIGTCKPLVKDGVLLRRVHPPYVFLVIKIKGGKHEKVPFLM